jgi:hypothetical protein
LSRRNINVPAFAKPVDVSGNSMKQLLSTIITVTFILLVASVNAQARTSLKAQAQIVIANLKKQNAYPIGAKDTLIDVNGDGYKDILIEYYGSAGTGLKNRILVYLYDNAKNKFIDCKQLNHLANPTFYFNKGIVAGYYLGNGGGGATKLRWNGSGLDTLEHIDIDVIYQGNDVRFKLVTIDFWTKKSTTKIFSVMTLPKEYNYFDYRPIIQNSSR